MANTARNRPGAPVTEVNEDNTTNPLENIQNKYDSNKKVINGVAVVVLVAVLGYFGYQQLYKQPNEKKATVALFNATKYFEMDSVQKALNGDGQHPGLEKIMKKFSGTSAANNAHYYAGVCYLKLHKFDQAIKTLKDFDGKGTALEYVANGCIGDAYGEKGDYKNAIEYYKKASSLNKDNGITALYLYRLGSVYELNNNTEEAKKTYKIVRDNYPLSPQAAEVEKQLARLGDIE